MVFWSDKVPLYGYFLIFWFAFTAFQMLGVESFGEAEFWLALFKLFGLCSYFLFSIIYVSGGLIGQTEAIGFRYWNDPGAFTNGFRGVAQVFVFASTFYAGVEAVAVAATETRNPSVAVPLAIRQVIWRILFVYMVRSPSVRNVCEMFVRQALTTYIHLTGGRILLRSHLPFRCGRSRQRS